MEAFPQSRFIFSGSTSGCQDDRSFCHPDIAGAVFMAAGNSGLDEFAAGISLAELLLLSTG